MRAGDAVKKGQALATLDSPALRNEYDRERATLDSLDAALARQEIEIRRQILQSRQQADLAKVAITAAEREKGRAQAAWDERVISERDYRRATDDLDTAKLNYDHATANAGLDRDSLALELRTKRLERDRQRLTVENLARRVEELTVRSPVDGMVANLGQSEKARVAESAPLVTVVDLTAFELEFQVAETYAGDIKAGMMADITLDGRKSRRHRHRDLAGGAPEPGDGPREIHRRAAAGPAPEPARQRAHRARRAERRAQIRARFLDRRSDALAVRAPGRSRGAPCRWNWAPPRSPKLKSPAASRRATRSSSPICATSTRSTSSRLRTEGTPAMLEMHNISKIFRADLIETHALRDFSLTVNAGEFVAVTGPSGSGKTTFLNVAGLLESFDTGKYLLDGADVSDLSDDERSRLRNEKIGFIFQGFNLIPDLNIFDNVDVPLRYRRMSAKERNERITSALDLVGLSSRTKHMPSQLSGGQQQRAAIARALAGDPKFLLADEPTGNLDSLMARQVLDLLEQINEMGTTIIMVTHDIELARRAQRNVHVVDGQISDFKSYETRATRSFAAAGAR